MIGKTISHYKILEKLGEGGMGVVYKAEDTKLGRTVALKFLSPELTRDVHAKERFVREAKAASVLDHPNICTLYETYEIEEETFIAMAFVDGQNLKERIESGPLSLEEALDIASQVAEGLQEAHDKGIIHRDIKSANIMLNQKGRARIMDFGLAKIAGKTKLTDTSMVMGTVDYMSPEQARGEPVDHRADIWSLGIVLYEMLSGRTPFEGTSDAALVHKIIYEAPPELTSLAPDTPPGLSAVVAHAMAKDKEERYASVSEFLEDLRDYEFLPPEKLAFSEKHASTRAISTARPAARKRFKLGISAAVVAALVCLCVALIWSFRRPETVEEPEPSRMEQEIRYCTSADGTRIAYAALGKGPPLVRVLGWFTHLEYEWKHPVNRASIDANAARYLSVRFDARGMGLSEHRVSDFSLEAQVADLEAVVDDLGLERFAIFAISQGGPTAIAYTIRHPERVSHLILYGTFDHWWYMDTEEGQQELETLVTLIRQGWSSDAPAHRQFFTGMFLPDATEVEYIQWFNELQRISTPAENAAALALSLRDLDVRHLLPKVKVPTLVIHRRGDSAVPFEMGKNLAMGIPGARFLPLAGRNHAILPYEPEAQVLGKAIAEFLSEGAQVSAKATSSDSRFAETPIPIDE